MANPDDGMSSLVQALEQLPELQRRVIVLTAYQEMSIEEVAQHLGMSIAAVRITKARAMASLRVLVKQRMEIADEIIGPTILPVYVDPGNAPEELLTELFSTLACVYRSLGGSGLRILREQRRSIVGELQ